VKKLAKILVTGGLVTILLVVLVLFLAPLLINPNNYKSEITGFIKSKSGRNVTIEGDISLAIIPWFGVKTGKILVDNKTDFSDKAFASVDSSEIKLKPFPLLSGKVEVNSVVLEGLTLNLVKDPQGHNNWDDLFATTPQRTPSGTANQSSQNITDSNPSVIAALGAINLKKGHVTWENRLAGKTFDFNNIEFSTDKVVLGEHLDINMTADIAGNQFSFPGSIKADIGLQADESLRNINLDNSKLEWSGKRLPSDQPLTAVIDLDETIINIKQQTLKSSGLVLQSGGIKIRADVNGEQILDKPALQGQITVEPFNLGLALKQWGINRLVFSDAKAMSGFSLKSQYRLTTESAELINLDAVLDDSHGKGSFGINNFAAPVVSFDLSVDAIDLDRYLPPQDKAEMTTPGLALAAGTISLPLDWLKKLDANGKLTLGKLKINRMNIQDAHLTVSGKNGSINVQQSAKPFYQGDYSSDLTINANTEKPQLALRENISNIQLEPYLQDIKGKAKLGGLLTTTTTLQGEGNNAKAIRTNLSGQVNFFLKDGFVQGFNLDKIIDQAKNAVKNSNKATEKGLSNQTAFKVIKGSLTINKGQINNNDLVIHTAAFRSKGEGTVLIETGQLDYKMSTKLLKAKATANSPEEFHSTPVVIHVGGTFNKPEFTLDVEALLSDKNKARLESLIDHNKDKIDKLINKLDKKSGSGVKDLLKKIF
jgi:AsmA protein